MVVKGKIIHYGEDIFIRKATDEEIKIFNTFNLILSVVKEE